MDNHRYDDWLALWAEDGQVTYWVPCNGDDVDPEVNVSIIYDTRTQLRNRITRLRETLWLREHAPRLRRVVSNVELEDETAAEVTASSNFILAQLHRQGQTQARLYGADGEVLGGLNAFYLLMDEPEVYGLPSNPKVPSNSVLRSAFWSILVGLLVAIGVLFRFRLRRQPEGMRDEG